MGELRAVYAVLPIENQLGAWLRQLYEGNVEGAGPLSKLIKPVDFRGDIGAYGVPHITLLDTVTVTSASQFDDIVKKVCQCSPLPQICANGVEPSSEHEALIVPCTCAGLATIRSALIAATRALVERSPLTDEEIQRAHWWIDKVSQHKADDRASLEGALTLYYSRGSPALPSYRNFRLNYFVKLYKRELRAGEEAKKAPFRTALNHFLKYGEPGRYGQDAKFHITLASKVDQSQALSLASDMGADVLVAFKSPQVFPIRIMGKTDLVVVVPFDDWLTTHWDGKRWVIARFDDRVPLLAQVNDA